MKFENMGLPDHPTLRKAYELIRADEKKYNPLFTNRTEMGVSIARILFETGASTDPDVLGAALLNQYFDDKKNSKFEAMFSARLVEVYRDTSPLSGSAKPGVATPEMAMIKAALNVHLLGFMQQRYLAEKKEGGSEFTSYSGAVLLEQVENYAKTVTQLAQNISHAGLKAHMEKSVAEANKLMNAPSSVKIRKPGSPRLDWGW